MEKRIQEDNLLKDNKEEKRINAAKRKVSTTILLERFLKKEELIFYKAKIDNITIYRLPYEVEKLDYKVGIFITSIPKTTKLQIGFTCKLNQDKDYSKELLDMNAEIPKGRLSVSMESSNVTYSHTFTLIQDDDIKKKYYENLKFCFYIIDKLLKSDIIQRDENEE